MKKSEKKMILKLVIVSIIIIGAIVFFTKIKNNNNSDENKANISDNVSNVQNADKYVKKQENGTKINTSKKLHEEKIINNLKIKNINLTEKDGQTIILVDVENPTQNDIESFSVDVILYDEKGNETTKIPGVIPETKAGETTQLNAGITAEFVNAYDFKIVETKDKNVD